MLRSRGISQICHTYSEDMHPIYPPLPWLHTPRLRLGVTTVAEDIWVHILLLGVVYPILMQGTTTVDSCYSKYGHLVWHHAQIAS